MNRNVVILLAATLLTAGCGHSGAESISSTTTPGNPIISFPDTEDRTVTTTLWSNPTTQVSGIAGQALTITVWHGVHPTDLLTVDTNGNLGLNGSLAVRGNVTTVSTRSQKKDITPYEANAMALLRHVRIVKYRYKNEDEATAPHIGFIAEDTPSDLSGPAHNRFLINNSVAVSIAAEQSLDRRERKLEELVQRLEAQIRTLKQSRR